MAIAAACAIMAAALPATAAGASVEGTSGRIGGDWIGALALFGSQSMVRVLHASPDAPAIDVWVDGAKAVSNLSYGNVSGYLTIPRGQHVVEVVPAGATEPVVLAGILDLASRTAYTIAAIGTLDTLQALALKDTTRPTGSNAHVRFVHASPDAPAVDVAVADGPVIFANTSFGNATEYVPVPSGAYDLEARLAGTDTVALEIPDVELSRRGAYTAYAVGLAADGTLQVVLAKDRGRG